MFLFSFCKELSFKIMGKVWGDLNEYEYFYDIKKRAHIRLHMCPLSVLHV